MQLDSYLSENECNNDTAILNSNLLINSSLRLVSACFRRVLAGKRIAPRWVLRTLNCERVEDCQVECGREKRFNCEGFNYRLDPSGQGKGVCELIEVPLGQMDIFSSANRRDENLIFHPDYDYYERDPNTCRPSPCSDCSNGNAGGGNNGNNGGNNGGNIGGNIGGGAPSSGGNRPYPDPAAGKEDYPATTYRPNVFVPPAYPERRPDPAGYGQTPQDPPPRPPPRYDGRPSDYDRYDVPRKPPPNWMPRPPPPSNGLDRYEPVRPIERPGFEITIYRDTRLPIPYDDVRPYRPPPYEPSYNSRYEPRPPIPDRERDRQGIVGPVETPPYLDRDRGRERENPRDRDLPGYGKPQKPFVPYSINQGYAGGYGSSAPSNDYWGLKREDRRPIEQGFNYFNLGGSRQNAKENSVMSYPGSKYEDRDRNNYGNLWTRRPAEDGKLTFIKTFFYLFRPTLIPIFIFIVARMLGKVQRRL